MRGEGASKFSPASKAEPKREARTGVTEELGVKTVKLKFTTTVRGQPASEIRGNVKIKDGVVYVYPEGSETGHYSFLKEFVQSMI